MVGSCIGEREISYEGQHMAFDSSGGWGFVPTLVHDSGHIPGVNQLLVILLKPEG